MNKHPANPFHPVVFFLLFLSFETKRADCLCLQFEKISLLLFKSERVGQKRMKYFSLVQRLHVFGIGENVIYYNLVKCLLYS